MLHHLAHRNAPVLALRQKLGDHGLHLLCQAENIAHRQSVLLLFTVGLQLGAGFIQFAQRGVYPAGKQMPRRGKHYAAPFFLKQFYAQLFFQKPHGVAQARLAYHQALGGACVVLGARQLTKILQLLQCHGSNTAPDPLCE